MRMVPEIDDSQGSDRDAQMIQVKNETEYLKRELHDLKKPRLHITDTEKLKDLEKEIKELKMQLKELQEPSRPNRSSTPTEKVMMRWPKDVLQKMKRKTKHHLKPLE